MQISFEQKSIVIVTAGAGLARVGSALALSFARLGGHVIIVDESASEAAKVASAVRGTDGKADSFGADSSDAAAMAKVADECAQKLIAVRVLINAQMASPRGTIEQTSPEVWSRTINSNLLGPIISARAFLPLLKTGGGSSIINMGSIDGTLGNPSVAGYSVSKGGLVPLTHIMASEFARFGIRSNCIARALIAGSSVEPQPLVDVTPLKRAATPEEIASVAIFLASDYASYVNGAVLTVDGGRSGITQGCFLRE